MLELEGKYNTAKVFTGLIEQAAIAQIINLLNQDFSAGSQIRIMPDVHAGAGCTIGTTMTVQDRVVPDLVGVDIGCGMETVQIKEEHIALQQLDRIIHEKIPAGFAVRTEPHPYLEKIDLKALRCAKSVNLNRAALSLGTLGGGNHFIELGKGAGGDIYLVVHTGSRHLGKQVAEYYQKAAAADLNKKRQARNALIQQLKQQGGDTEIQKALDGLSFHKVDKNLAFVEGDLFDDYIHDMAVVQRYAAINRKAIVQEILKGMHWRAENRFTTIHNYIDMDTKPFILRKGAISAKAGEKVLIPMNMRDGSLICIGKGNPDWNYSAPHGAGRLMSRSAAKQSFTLGEFEKTMEGIYTTTVNKSTLDEAPFAYKPMAEITANIGDTVDIVAVIKPVYNFKAAE